MGSDELRALGLDPPNASLRVRGADESTTLAEVRIGVVRQGGGIVAQTAGNPTVFELDPVLAEYVPVSLETFRQDFVTKPQETGGAAEAGEGEDDTPEATAGAEDAAPAAESP
jgi:hypothetical protein